MTFGVTLATTFAGTGLARRVATVALAFANAIYRWYRRERDLRHLMQFDDHLLRDIGLTRGQVMRGVLPPFRQR
jgi:uncharacterized protein YjiS (DUF1127 family)